MMCARKRIFFIIILLLSSLISNSSITDVYACTNFKIKNDQTVYFGNSEDHVLSQISETYISFVPEGYSWFNVSTVKYGAVFVGYGNSTENSWVQGGMNEAGLAFDLTGVPYTPPNLHSERPRFLVPEILECATVSEVIEYKKTHSVYQQDGSIQSFFVDRSGESVVFNIGEDGEFHYYRNNSSYQLATNYYVEDPSRRNPGSDAIRRYDAAETMLKTIVKDDKISLESLSSVLEAVHFEGSWVNTLYSNIFDVANGDVYLYYFHQTEKVVKLNLGEELAKGRHNYRISDLFTIEIVEKEYSEYFDYPFIIRIFPADLMLLFTTMILDAVIIISLMFLMGKKLFSKINTPIVGGLETKGMASQSIQTSANKVPFRGFKIQIILSLAVIWSFLSFSMIYLNRKGEWWPFFDSIPILQLPLQPFYAYYNIFLFASLLSVFLITFSLSSLSNTNEVIGLFRRGLDSGKGIRWKNIFILCVPALIGLFSLILEFLNVVPKIDWLMFVIMYPLIATILVILVPYAEKSGDDKLDFSQDKFKTNLLRTAVYFVLVWGLWFLPLFLTRMLDHMYILFLMNLIISVAILPFILARQPHKPLD